MAIEGAGAFFGMLDPLRLVYKYLKEVQETREVKKRLGDILKSLDTFEKSGEASKRAGKALREKVKTLRPPITLPELVDIMKLSIEYSNNFQSFLSSIREFGRECRGLNSGDFEAFMQKVKTRKPDVYDIMNFFGRNYSPDKRTLDLTRLPILIRAYGTKADWKESKKLSEQVAEGRREVEDLIEKVKVIRTQRIPFKDRALALAYIRSFQRLGREGGRFVVSKSTLADLKQASPSWYVELVGMTSLVRKSLPRGI
ncbi:MAG: hypothetical protein JRM73_02880 [Nitrososphaerota archaeon]|nr:hypothetical protein [Nitrososphaerota archaeon]